jgi:hypothetical protein
MSLTGRVAIVDDQANVLAGASIPVTAIKGVLFPGVPRVRCRVVRSGIACAIWVYVIELDLAFRVKHPPLGILVLHQHSTFTLHCPGHLLEIQIPQGATVDPDRMSPTIVHAAERDRLTRITDAFRGAYRRMLPGGGAQ